MMKFIVVVALAVLAIFLLLVLSWQQQQAQLPDIIQTTVVPQFTPANFAAAPQLAAPVGELPADAVTLRGSALPGHSVQALIDGKPFGRVLVDPSGAWDLTGALPAAGTYLVRLQLLDALDELIAQGDSIPLAVAPAAGALAPPVIRGMVALDAAPHGGEGLIAGPIVVTGTGTSGQIVEAVIANRTVATAPVGAGGVWTVTVDVRAPGIYPLTVRALDEKGGVLGASAPAVLRVDAPTVPIVAVTNTPEPSATPTATATPAPSPTPEPTRAPPVVMGLWVDPGAADAPRLVLNGTGAAGDDLLVAIDGTVVATSTVDVQGIGR
ncbi:MAG: hypothetical protein IPK16_20180 [Anaerolineales bacterium]|nr:hypothetical protein [Anaerolineales bacterium]